MKFCNLFSVIFFLASLGSSASGGVHNITDWRAYFEAPSSSVVEVLEPGRNARVDSPTVTVRGRVKSTGFPIVRISVNEGEWFFETGSTNWDAQVSLVPGANKIRIFGTDETGKRTATNTLAVTFVKTQPFVLSIKGDGTVLPNLNGKALEVGKQYSMTATPRTLWRFGRWSGQFARSNRTLSFTMPDFPVSEVLEFDDAGVPTVAFIEPKATDVLPATKWKVSGKAADNVEIREVVYSLDGGDWQRASGTTNWIGEVELTAGNHTLRARAVDSSGSFSAVAVRTLRAADYRGIYFGSYLDGDGTNVTGMVVTANQEAVMLGNTWTIDAAKIGVNGIFEGVDNEIRLFGSFKTGGFSGTIEMNGVTRPVSGTKKAAPVGDAQGGYFIGAYVYEEFPGAVEYGEIRAIVALDEILFRAIPYSYSANVPGIAQSDIDGGFSVRMGGKVFGGSLVDGSASLVEGKVFPQIHSVFGGGGNFEMKRLLGPNDLRTGPGPMTVKLLPWPWIPKNFRIFEWWTTGIASLGIDGEIAFRSFAGMGRFRVESSTDLVNWVPVDEWRQGSSRNPSEIFFREGMKRVGSKFFRVVGDW